MIGSGLGNFGGGINIYGQQEWQKRAREQAFTNRFGQSMMNQRLFGQYGEGRKSPEEMQFDALQYASQPFAQTGTDVGGFYPNPNSLIFGQLARQERLSSAAPQQSPTMAGAGSNREMGSPLTAGDMLRPENFKVRTRTTGGGITASITPSLDWYRDIQRLRFPQMGRMAYS